MPDAHSGDAEIYYETRGSGPAVVFAHGAGGNRVSWWQQVPVFAEGHTVVSFDHRGFGRSTCPADAFHPRHFPADLLAILDAEGLERVALVCQSMGGWTGLRTALEHPERIACLVLASTPGGLATPVILAAAARIGARVDSEGVRGNAALAPDFPARRPDLAFLYDQIAALNTSLDPRLLGRLFEPEARIAPERLPGYRVPTLVLSGDRDQLFPPDGLREVAEALPGALLRSFPGIGHSIYFEDAESFNSVVAEFVDKHL
jgi:pimeloyl-ACP methyl ester carboxylesterase